jgi:hypothetical protein
MKGYSLETHLRVYDDSEGAYISVGEDADNLGCVEVMTAGEGNKKYWGDFRLAVTPDAALLLAEAIRRVAEDLKARESK